MTDLFGSLGIAPGIGILLAALGVGALTVLKIQEMIRDRGRDDHGRPAEDPDLERLVEKQISNAMTIHLMKLDAQRAEWALDAQRAREQHDRQFREELWAGVDAIREALDDFRKGAA